VQPLVRFADGAPASPATKQASSLEEVRSADPDGGISAETPVPPASGALSRLSPRVWAGLCAGVGAALAGGLVFVVTATDPARPHAEPMPVPPPPAESVAVGTAVTFAAVVPGPDASAAPAKPVPPPVWRVQTLASDPTVSLLEGTFGKKTFQAALAGAGISARESLRVAHALQRVRRLDHVGEKDTFLAARDKATGRIVAFELASSPIEIWQAREDEKKLDAKKLDLYVDHKRVSAAFVVADDLRASVKQAGLREDKLLDVLDDALEGHVGLADIHTGARFRLVADEEWVEGSFTRYAIQALEYQPAHPNAEETKKGPLRVYHLVKADRHGQLAYYDAKGQRPIQGAWRSPLPMARVTSRFNPHRMHPVLKVVMPHNGIDFGAAAGTPVYSAGPGVVESVGDGGPCGNMVQVRHPNGLVTAYCHLSKFAPGLYAGEHVEARQLVGFVGQTGRATGPHLHFGVRRGDVFLDPLSLKLDGVRVVPLHDRGEFASVRAETDLALDAIAPATPPASASAGAGASVDGGASAASGTDEDNVDNH
jgi:murein DD-endopeptidase MepM/ murein hydrolase activator NlpD